MYMYVCDILTILLYLARQTLYCHNSYSTCRRREAVSEGVWEGGRLVMRVWKEGGWSARECERDGGWWVRECERKREAGDWECGRREAGDWECGRREGESVKWRRLVNWGRVCYQSPHLQVSWLAPGCKMHFKKTIFLYPIVTKLLSFHITCTYMYMYMY